MPAARKRVLTPEEEHQQDQYEAAREAIFAIQNAMQMGVTFHYNPCGPADLVLIRDVDDEPFFAVGDVSVFLNQDPAVAEWERKAALEKKVAELKVVVGVFEEQVRSLEEQLTESQATLARMREEEEEKRRQEEEGTDR